jgi:hypothetical protein
VTASLAEFFVVDLHYPASEQRALARWGEDIKTMKASGLRWACILESVSGKHLFQPQGSLEGAFHTADVVSGNAQQFGCRLRLMIFTDADTARLFRAAYPQASAL